MLPLFCAWKSDSEWGFCEKECRNPESFFGRFYYFRDLHSTPFFQAQQGGRLIHSAIPTFQAWAIRGEAELGIDYGWNWNEEITHGSVEITIRKSRLSHIRIFGLIDFNGRVARRSQISSSSAIVERKGNFFVDQQFRASSHCQL